MAEEYPRATHTRSVFVYIALSLAYVTYVPILRCVRTHEVNGAYPVKVNCETRSRAPVVIKKPREVWLLFVTIVLFVELSSCKLAKSTDRERQSRPKSTHSSASLCSSLTDGSSTVFERRHRRLGQCLQRLLLYSSEDEARSLLA